MAVTPSGPPLSFRNTVSENIKDPVSSELMTRAVTLFPCGHILNEDTAIKCLARDKLCPFETHSIEGYIPNYTIRTLVETAGDPPVDSEGPSSEAQHHFEKGKALVEQNNHEAAIPILLETLRLSPCHEEAQAYLDLCLQRTSEPHPSSEKKVSRKHDIEASDPSNPKEDYINLLLSLLEKSRIKKLPTLPGIFQEQIKELMSREKFTQKQQESYRWTQKLYIDHKVSSFVTQELEALHGGTSEQSVSLKEAKTSPKSIPAPVATPTHMHRKEAVTASSIAFGKAEWAKYFGDVGSEPPLPSNIDEILNAPCPFWPDKRVHETHLLTLIPQTVRTGKTLRSLTVTLLKGLMNQLLEGHPTTFDLPKGPRGNQTRYDSQPVPSHWALLSRDVIPDSRNKTYHDQKKLVSQNPSYEVPHILDVAVSILMEHVRSNIRLYRSNPSKSTTTYTRCQEKCDSDHQVVVGGYGKNGLSTSIHFSIDCEAVGVGAQWKF